MIPTTAAAIRAALKATARADYLALVPTNGDPPVYVAAGLVRRALEALPARMGARAYVELGLSRSGLVFQWGRVGRLRLTAHERHTIGEYRGRARVWTPTPPARPAYLEVRVIEAETAAAGAAE
jgi:hypothetical protein